VEEALKRAEELGASFVDVRYTRVRTSVLVANETREYVESNGVTEGALLRVLVDGDWGLVSLRREPRSEDAERAVRNALGDRKSAVVYLKSKKAEVSLPLNPNPLDFSLEEKMTVVRRIRDEVMKLEGVKAVTVSYREVLYDKRYLSSDSRDVSQTYGYDGVSVTVVIKRGDLSLTVFDRFYSYKRFVLFDVADKLIESMGRKVQEKMRAVSPKVGKFPVVMAPEVVGVFAHEAVGHLSEADLAVSGIFSDKLGKPVASEIVSISDSPMVDDEQAIGSIIYDDEGVEARKVEIIKKGVLNEFLNDRYYAAYLGANPTGNARAEGPISRPLVRMRNTHFEPGDSTREELVSEVKEGYLLVSMSGGQTNNDGTFQFGIDEAYEIVNGEVGRPVTFLGITGSTLETLKRVSGVSKELEFSPGFCGKMGQTVPVSDGGPYVRVDEVRVGGV
jgi:Predicted Zn-dependent proteases and their inactivated homologs